MKRAIEASTTIDVPLEQVRQVLADDPGGVVAEHVEPEDRQSRRFRSELGVDLGAGSGIRQAVVIEVGHLRTEGDVARLPLRWQAAGRDRLFPVFDGHLDAGAEGDGATRLVVQGTYEVPLGAVGRFGDGVIGRRLARQSLTSFVEEMAARLDAEVHRRMASTSWRPAPYPVSLRESASDTA